MSRKRKGGSKADLPPASGRADAVAARSLWRPILSHLLLPLLAFGVYATTPENAGAVERAAGAYERALRIKSDSVSALNGLAVMRRAEKNYAAARDLLLRAVAIDPRFTEAHLNLGLVYFDQQEFAEGAAAFRKAIEVGETYPDVYLAHCGLGVVYSRLNLLDEAAEEFRKTLMLNPRYAPAQEAWERVRGVLKK